MIAAGAGKLVAWWHRTPLYLRIVFAVVIGVLTGLALGENAAGLQIPSRLVLRLLGALAPPLILLAIIEALLEAKIGGRSGVRLAGLLLLNTLVAISVGLLVANTLRPGSWVQLEPSAETHAAEAAQDLLTQFLDNVPKSLLGPLGDDGKVIGVVLLGVAFALALRRVQEKPIHTVKELVQVALRTLIIVLHWLIDLVPLAVFGVIASIVGTKGFADFIALGAFVLSVLVALALQAGYYLTRIRFGSWVRPADLLRGTRDALVMAFSTASSTATMPVTYASLVDNVGLREQSASLGALVGANFNNDGTALYEAMSALFVAQMLGIDLTMGQQLMVVFTSIIASVGAAGIPEAGLVTMTLVFKSVKIEELPEGHLPLDYIAILLTVDWFLDRCRTAINVMGDASVSCLLDGKERKTTESVPTTSATANPATVAPAATVSTAPSETGNAAEVQSQ